MAWGGKSGELMKKTLLLIGIIFLLAACGKKGPLIPPEAFVPAPIADLKVGQKGNAFMVCWTPPGREESGRPLKDLAGFLIFKREVLPPGEDCEECPTAYRMLRDVDLEYLQDVRRFGSRLCIVDSDLVEGNTYQYKAVSMEKNGATSRDSNKVRRKYLQPPTAPALKASLSPTGVLLEWTAPVHTKYGTVAGYNIYRRQSGGIMSLSTVNDKPVQEHRFEDLTLEPGVHYQYVVRTIIKVDGEAVESVPSNEVAGELSMPEQ
jgi:predicted small lipoprotein YifL